MASTRIAVVGCGAVAKAHLPVIRDHADATTTVLVDKALSRAQDLASEFSVEHALEDYREVPGKADAAIVALPHHLHCPVTVDLLSAGVHVFVEKPMAMSVEECDKMNAAAEKGGAKLAVGMARRFYAASQWVKKSLEGGMLGKIQSFDFREGSVYDWPVASDFMFRKDAGGGVLADTGAHLLDTLLWWLGGWEDVKYRDDSHGGVEADCELQLRMKSGAEGTVRMSRTRALRNTYIIRGEAGILEIESNFNPTARITLDGHDGTLVGNIQRDSAPDGAANPMDCFNRQMADFIESVRDDRPLFVPGTEGKLAVELIEACYKVREPLQQAWV